MKRLNEEVVKVLLIFMKRLKDKSEGM